MQIFGLQQNLVYFVICIGFAAAREVPVMLNAAETHGHGEPLPQKPNSVQPASAEM